MAATNPAVDAEVGHGPLIEERCERCVSLDGHSVKPYGVLQAVWVLYSSRETVYQTKSVVSEKGEIVGLGRDECG